MTQSYRTPDGTAQNWTPAQMAEHIRSLDIVTVKPQPYQWKMRFFLVEFDNSKKRRPHIPLQQYTAEGVEFSSGHVVIDTFYAPRPDYTSIEEMTEVLQEWGECKISWLKGEGQ